MPEPFSFSARFKSFTYALAGLGDLVRNQHNARIHLLATVVVVSLAWLFSLARWEWAVLILAIGAVWAAEALNTALEYLADACHPDQHPLIKQAKDAAAAAVLLVSVSSTVVGLLVFFPYFFD